MESVTTAGAGVSIGERFNERVLFDADSIRRFAAISGDHNPLHHDDAFAARSAFGSLIASGPHVVARMMGITATYFTRRHDALGLDYGFRFVRAVPAGTTLDLVWKVTAVAHKASLRGHVVDMDGRALDDSGVAYVTGRGTILLRPLALRRSG